MITELDRDQMGFLASRSVALFVLQRTKTTIVQVGPPCLRRSQGQELRGMIDGEQCRKIRVTMYYCCW
jgi:hypothetical protein